MKPYNETHLKNLSLIKRQKSEPGHVSSQNEEGFAVISMSA